ncbi:MAG: sugar-binding domain-containing protein [Planctomycetota bacterium]
MRNRLAQALSLLAIALGAAASPAIEVVDSARFNTSSAPDGWQAPAFDDSGWQEVTGGVGTPGTPNARIGALWNTSRVWLRKRYTLDAAPADLRLYLHHDEDARVFLNGQLIAEVTGYSTNYKLIQLGEESRRAAKVGENTLAVFCRQTDGGQYLDVHLVEGPTPPTLPRLKRKPFTSDLITKWGEGVTADNAWTEYPRPQLQREQWTNLNGHWDYAVTAATRQQPPADWDGQILVPFCLESKLGGVSKVLEDDQALWYRRIITGMPAAGMIRCLNFEAVDYRCQAFVNGQFVGEHQGGNTPFSFDVTSALGEGKNELIVRVEDDTEKFQLRGKQTLTPRGVWYTQVSGIWQTVWLEDVPDAHLSDIKIATDAAAGAITLQPITAGRGRFTVSVKDGEKVVARGESTGGAISLTIPDAKLWSPDSPHLYGIEATFAAAGGRADRVTSYAGIRTVGRERDADGHLRFTLNGEPVFHWGPLDQGWWPEGLLTPPADEALTFEIEWLKAAGFNMIRKHIKVEPRRYYYHCDRLGMMVWQDHVSGGPDPAWSRLKPGPKRGTWPDAEHKQFMRELEAMVGALENHPSIVVWVPFNEAWGQHSSTEVGRWMVERDPSRLVNIASGGNFWPVGHIVDAHKYPHPDFPFEQGEGGRFDDYIKVVGEFGGHGYPVRGHLWDPARRNWGYGGLPANDAEYAERYKTSIAKLNELRLRGIAGGVYTQTTDVEGEINGLMTYDRKVIKLPAEELSELSRVLFQDQPVEANTATSATKKKRAEDVLGFDDPRTSFDAVPTDGRPSQVMPREESRDGLESQHRTPFVKPCWILDPGATLGTNDVYCLTSGVARPPGLSN